MPFIDKGFSRKRSPRVGHRPIKRKADFTEEELAVIQRTLEDRIRQADPIKLEIFHQLQNDDVNPMRRNSSR